MKTKWATRLIYTDQAAAMFRERAQSARPSAPDMRIYLYADHKNNHGRIQEVFDYMRSGEWLTTVMARELWKMSPTVLRWCIATLRKRGYQVETEVIKYTAKYHEYYTQFRLSTWEPKTTEFI